MPRDLCVREYLGGTSRLISYYFISVFYITCCFVRYVWNIVCLTSAVEPLCLHTRIPMTFADMDTLNLFKWYSFPFDVLVVLIIRNLRTTFVQILVERRIKELITYMSNASRIFEYKRNSRHGPMSAFQHPIKYITSTIDKSLEVTTRNSLFKFEKLVHPKPFRLQSISMRCIQISNFLIVLL